MQPKLTLKQKVYYIFEGGHEQYKNITKRFDTFMMLLIFMNVVAFTVETVESIHKSMNVFFFWFENISIAIFTLEYLIRLWCITENEKYRHPVKGRLRFMATPIAFIDLIAFLPTYLPFLFPMIRGDLRVVRAFRLFRLFRLLKLWRYSASIRLLVKIIITKKEDLQVIFFTIFLLLVVAASLMFMIEKENQPEKFSSIPQTMWWAVSTLTTVGYGDVYPITSLGKALGAFIALLGIGLFALPAGIISAGFMQEIDLNSKNEIVEKNTGSIKQAFYTSPHKIGSVSTTRRLIDVVSLKSRLELSEEDIFDAIKNNELRIRYKKNAREDRFANTYVIEHFECNREYGSYINRDTNITIVSPMSYAEHSIGHFTSHLAKYIKADYISNEMYGEASDLNSEYAFSFTFNDAFRHSHEEGVPLAFTHFKEDLSSVIQSDETVFIIKASDDAEPEHFNLHFGGQKDEKNFSIAKNTFKDIPKLKLFYQELKQAFSGNPYNYTFAMHRYYDNTHPNSLHQYISRSTDADVATIYINADLIEWTDDRTYFQIIKTLGDTIRKVFHYRSDEEAQMWVKEDIAYTKNQENNV